MEYLVIYVIIICVMSALTILIIAQLANRTLFLLVQNANVAKIYIMNLSLSSVKLNVLLDVLLLVAPNLLLEGVRLVLKGTITCMDCVSLIVRLDTLLM